MRPAMLGLAGSDPAYRVAARLGVLSAVLGVAGFVLGFCSLKGCS